MLIQFSLISFSRPQKPRLLPSLNVARFRRAMARQGRTDQLVNQHAKENDIAYHRTIRAQRLRDRNRHAQRNACLRRSVMPSHF